ncbi:transferase [Parazoarcus communis]|uniref:Transferase n=1 Tax=Parazoarcus communis TaxID=41977 RepID=A0A2U8H1W1_9RHOO|nr:transferase [Parazoarcus communis]AWI79969.1 transferase [Parazoarcus communis]
MPAEIYNVFYATDELNELLCKQIRNNFFLSEKDIVDVSYAVNLALLRTNKCFVENNNKYYWSDSGEVVFNPFHSGQYSIFLYFASQEAVKCNNRSLADRIYYLNKMLNGCDIYYEVMLPDVFFLEHPVASVMGRASYGNYFVFQQGCTVGGNHGYYPRFGEFVWLFANATVIGNTSIGSNVFVSAGTLVKDEVVPDNTIVFGQSPNLILKTKPSEYFYKSSPFKAHNEILARQS